MTLRAWLVPPLATTAIALATVMAACGDKVQPTGSTLIKDVPTPPSAPSDDAGDEPIFDGGGTSTLDAYGASDADYAACLGCTCSASTSFCFGGASPRAPGGAGGAGDAGDAGPSACAIATSATPQIGCNNLPAACAAKPTCPCIIDTLQPMYRCYLNCQLTKDNGFLVYCPNP